MRVVGLCLALAAVLLGAWLAPVVVEGVWAWWWPVAEGSWEKGGDSYRFTLPAAAPGAPGVEASAWRWDAWPEPNSLENINSLFAARRWSEPARREPLRVRVNMREPRRSLLVPGVPAPAAGLLLLLAALVAPLPHLLRLDRARGAAAAAGAARGAGICFLFFLLAFGASLGSSAAYGYLLRSGPPAAPALLLLLFAFPLLAVPPWFTRLADSPRARRAAYLAGGVFLLPPLAFLAALAYPLALGLAAGVVALTAVFSPVARPQKPWAGSLAAVAWVPVYLAGLLAPLRFLVLFLHHHLPYSPYYAWIPGQEPPRVAAWLDAGTGAAAVLVAVVLTTLDARWRRRQEHLMEDLPTSRARSAAIGPAEFSGTARKYAQAGVEDLGPNGGPIIHYDSRTRPHPHAEPFLLEDATGSILVDPRGVRLRRGRAFSLFGRLREMVLVRRERRAELLSPHSLALLPGDPVYVVGNVQMDPAAPGGLAVRPLAESAYHNPLWRLLYGETGAPEQRESRHVFFLTDGPEGEARRAVRRGLWQVWLAAMLWVAAGVWMVQSQWPRTRPGYNEWSLREVMAFAPVGEKLERMARPIPDPGLPAAVSRLPLVGPLLVEADAGMRRSQQAEAVNWLWQGAFDPASAPQAEVVRRILRSPEREYRRAAAFRLRNFPAFAADAVPALTAALDDPYPAVRSAAAGTLGEMAASARPAVPALRRLLDDGEAEVRLSAAWTLRKMALPAGEALPIFIPLLAHHDRMLRHQAAEALGDLKLQGASAVQPLSRALADGESVVRNSAAAALGRIGPSAAAAVPRLTRALAGKDAALRKFSASSLGEIGPAAEAAVPLLAGLLADEDQWVRAAAADALSRIAPCSLAGARALAPLLSDRVERVRESALDALVRAGPACAPAASALLRVVEGGDSPFSRRAARALASAGPGLAPVVPALTRALASPDPWVRRAGADALAAAGPAAAGASSALRTIFASDPDQQVRSAAWGALSRIHDTDKRRAAAQVLAKKEHSAGDLPALTGLLGDYQENVRRVAAEAVGGMGPVALPALPEVRILLSDPWPFARAGAAYALGRMGEGAAGAAPDLLPLLSDPERTVRQCAVEALGRFGPRAGERAAVAIAPLAGDPDEAVRRMAAEALGSIKLGAGAAVPALAALLADPSPSVRVEAAQALAPFGAHALSALPALAKALTDGEGRVRTRAAASLGAMGPAAAAAVSALAGALSDPDSRDEAAVALGRIGPAAREALPALRALTGPEQPYYLRRDAEQAIRLIE